jgi:tRNA-dihydrouridine synthase B
MNLSLAPILGHTDFVFRNTHCRHFKGLNSYFTPFITTVKGKIVKDSHIRDALPKYNKLAAVVPQLIGKNPDEFILLANQLSKIGYGTVNWNLGCPYPMVVNKKRGAGLLPFPEMIQDFLSSVIPHITCGLSVKTRLGKDDPEEILAVLAIMNGFPIREIIIHPRTARQMYDGMSDLDSFAKCLAVSKHPVVYNGDIVDTASFKNVSARFPSLTRFMIGRGVLMNPSLPETLKGITVSHKKSYGERLYRFHEDLVNGYRNFGSGDIGVLGKLKQLWCYLSFSLPDRETSLREIQRAKTMDRYWEAVDQAFNNFR